MKCILFLTFFITTALTQRCQPQQYEEREKWLSQHHQECYELGYPYQGLCDLIINLNYEQDILYDLGIDIEERVIELNRIERAFEKLTQIHIDFTREMKNINDYGLTLSGHISGMYIISIAFIACFVCTIISHITVIIYMWRKN